MSAEETKPGRVLVVDDEKIIRDLITKYLQTEGYATIQASGGREAVALFERERPDMVLTDLAMPDGDGLSVVAGVAAHSRETPVIVISGQNEIDAAMRAIRAGAWDFITKPISPMETLLHALVQAREKGDLLRENREHREHLEEEIVARTRQLEETMTRLRRTTEGIVHAMALTIEARDPYTAGHQQRVADLAVAMAGEMGLAEDKKRGIHLAGVIHDLGKIHVPAEILSKPGMLTDAEFSLIKTHPETGYNILKTIDFPWPIAEIVLQHHEKLDGSGYPLGLTDKEIIPEARVLVVADIVEAMAAHRPYRPTLGIDRALAEIIEGRGTTCDSAAVDACLRLFREKGYAFAAPSARR